MPTELEWEKAARGPDRLKYPWISITIFFLAGAITGSMVEIPWEIIYVNVITGFGFYVAIRFEEELLGY